MGIKELRLSKESEASHYKRGSLHIHAYKPNALRLSNYTNAEHLLLVVLRWASHVIS